MIIQLRGTSGSGKSFAMRAVMEMLGGWEPVHVTKRKRPLYYWRDGRPNKPTIAVLGHYDSPCGGCDTIGSARAVYDLIQVIQAEKLVDTILCEGLLLSEDTKWSLQLQDLRCLFLATPLERCLKQIESRRRQIGNEAPLNPKNTTNRISTIDRARAKLTEAGVPCCRVSTNQASRVILQWVKSLTSTTSAANC